MEHAYKSNIILGRDLRIRGKVDNILRGTRSFAGEYADGSKVVSIASKKYKGLIPITNKYIRRAKETITPRNTFIHELGHVEGGMPLLIPYKESPTKHVLGLLTNERAANKAGIELLSKHETVGNRASSIADFKKNMRLPYKSYKVLAVNHFLDRGPIRNLVQKPKLTDVKNIYKKYPDLMKKPWEV